MKFDELNRLREYFADMNLSEKDKEKRALLGAGFYDAFVYILALMWTDSLLNEDLDRLFYIDALTGRLTDASEESGIDFDETYISRIAEEVVDSTIAHYAEEEYFSDERALRLAGDESNAVCNDADREDAKKQGKKYKIWQSAMIGERRWEHIMMDGVKIPIDDYFEVMGEQLKYPCDMIGGSAKNNAHCQCTIRYE